MTPTFCWVFLLALVGRAASMPQPLVVDACALICNPGAETEAERERDTTIYPRYPKVNCKLQSDGEEHQAWVIVSHCLKLCNVELSPPMEANCFALRSSLGANLGCYCEALTPLSPNTMRLHESWRLNFLVKELANDIITTISSSPLDMLVICEIHNEFISTHATDKTFKSCRNESKENPDSHQRTARRVQDEVLISPRMEQLMKLQDEKDEDHLDIEEKIKSKRMIEEDETLDSMLDKVMKLKEEDNDYTKEEGIKMKREIEKDEALNNTPSKKLVESEDAKDTDQNMEEGIKEKIETEKEKIETKMETEKETNVETNMKTDAETNMETNTKTNTETNTKTKTEINTETSTKTNTETNTKNKNECLGRNVGENHEEKELCEKNNARGGRGEDDDCEKCRLG